jgi:anthranilate phosphoribosyltransferase
MKNVAQARKLVSNRTAFNLLGPLCNPAKVKHQLIGVYSRDYLSRIISILKSRGSENVMTVISDDGLDELTTTSNNHICHFNNYNVTNFFLEPTKMGLTKGKISDLQVSTKEEAVHAFISVLKGTANQTMIETTALNSAAGLIVGGISERFDETLEISLQSIKNGKAYQHFRDFVSYCGDKKKLETDNN